MCESLLSLPQLPECLHALCVCACACVCVRVCACVCVCVRVCVSTSSPPAPLFPFPIVAPIIAPIIVPIIAPTPHRSCANPLRRYFLSFAAYLVESQRARGSLSEGLTRKLHVVVQSTIGLGVM